MVVRIVTASEGSSSRVDDANCKAIGGSGGGVDNANCKGPGGIRSFSVVLATELRDLEVRLTDAHFAEGCACRRTDQVPLISASALESHPLSKCAAVERLSEEWPAPPEPAPPPAPPTADGRVSCETAEDAALAQADRNGSTYKHRIANLDVTLDGNMPPNASSTERPEKRSSCFSGSSEGKASGLADSSSEEDERNQKHPWVRENWKRLTSSLLNKSEKFATRECWQDDKSAGAGALANHITIAPAPQGKSRRTGRSSVLARLSFAGNNTNGEPSNRDSCTGPDDFMGSDIVRGMWQKHSYHRHSQAVYQKQPKSASFDNLDSVHTWNDFREALCNKLVLHPYSSKRVVWILLGLFFMSFDILQLTMDVFELPPSATFRNTELVANVYWTLDIFISFITGAFVSSQLDLNHYNIARRYIKTWFFFDLILAISQWMFLWLDRTGTEGSEDALAEHSGVFRYFRLARYSRLLRFAKLDQLMASALERLNSVMAQFMFRVSMYLFGLILWVHVSGSAWYWVGLAEGGWANQLGLEHQWPLNYLVAMHWAATQFQGNITFPINDSCLERAYAMVHTLVAVVVLATFVSKLTTVMHAMEEIRRKNNRQVSMVRRYCEAHAITTEVSLRVRKYVEWKQALDTKQQHDANETELMQDLPVDLRRALLGETRSTLVASHIVFLACRESHLRFFQRLCCDSMTPLTNLPDVNVFSYGMLCTRMYFVVAGSLAYLKYGAVLRALNQNGTLLRNNGSGQTERPRARAVNKDVKVCEPVLWTRWVHLGDFTSVTHVSMLAVEIGDFEKLVEAYPSVQLALRLHAQRFVTGLNARQSFDLCDMFSTDSILGTS